jgi:hypothetical protein
MPSPYHPESILRRLQFESVVPAHLRQSKKEVASFMTEAGLKTSANYGPQEPLSIQSFNKNPLIIGTKTTAPN